jgi:hypothetical protein
LRPEAVDQLGRMLVCNRLLADVQEISKQRTGTDAENKKC